MINRIIAIWRFAKKFKRNSIFFRNMILIVIILCLLLSAVSLLLYNNTKKNINREISLIGENNAIIAKNSVDSILKTADRLAVQTSLTQNVQSLLLTAYTDNTILNLQERLRNDLHSSINVHSYLDSIYVYSEKTGLLMDTQQLHQLEDYEDQGWYDEYQSCKDSKAFIFSRKKYDTYPVLITLIRPVVLTDFDKIGCVVINLSVDEINKTINDVSKMSSFNFLVYNKENRILLSRDINQINSNLFELTGLDSNFTEKENIGNLSIGSDDFFYTQVSSNYFDLYYLSMIEQARVDAIANHPLHFIVLVTFLILLFGIIIALYISFYTYKPVYQTMSQLFTSHTNDENIKQNELSYIMNVIEQYQNENLRLTEEHEYNALLLNQSQLYALQAQINPHFLNNVFESINWTAIEELGEDNKISDIIYTLSALFDISLDSEHYLIPIEQELRHVNLYIDLMKLNYDLDFTWDIEKDIINCKILKFTLQPIIENALLHGVLPKRCNAIISVTGRFHEDGILITVSDNGIGMEPAVLADLQHNLQSDNLQSRHIGIHNVNKRIKLVFGERYGLSLISKKNEGTTVNIFIPRMDP